jgi:hypothetical protein
LSKQQVAQKRRLVVRRFPCGGEVPALGKPRILSRNLVKKSGQEKTSQKQAEIIEPFRSLG